MNSMLLILKVIEIDASEHYSRGIKTMFPPHYLITRWEQNAVSTEPFGALPGGD